MAGIDELEALFAFNLAPVQTRRDIAMLGVIHRAVLGQGPVHLQTFFKKSKNEAGELTRLQRRRHDRQIVEYRNGFHTEYIKRSALGLASVYNLLPGSIVTHTRVSSFQNALQGLVKERALGGCADWRESLSPRVELWRHPLLCA